MTNMGEKAPFASNPFIKTIATNLAQVEDRIQAACRSAGRRREEVAIVAVTKGRSPAEMDGAFRCGLQALGENRIEELEAKRPILEADIAPGRPEWHVIGHVQSRKAERVAASADLIHSVDSVRLAERLERAAATGGRRLPVLLQVNVSGEASKSGFAAQTPADREALLEIIETLRGLPHLDIEGLMTIAPLTPESGLVRDVFRRTRMLLEHIREIFPDREWAVLSMGMSGDFELAIEEGATLIRVGRALFEPLLRRGDTA